MPGKDPASTPGGQQNEYLQRAYALDGVDAARGLYNEWAKEYDVDLQKHAYASPQVAVETWRRHWPSTYGSNALEILDAGCGTGLVGYHLMQTCGEGMKIAVDGVDLTPGMLAVAKQKGVYRDLWPVDLNEKLNITDEKYDVVFCVGTLTKAHVGPNCFAEFARVTKEDGLIIATVHDEIWESHGFKTEVEALGSRETVDIISTAEFGILENQTSGGRMVVLKRKSTP